MQLPEHIQQYETIADVIQVKHADEVWPFRHLACIQMRLHLPRPGEVQEHRICFLMQLFWESILFNVAMVHLDVEQTFARQDAL